MTQNPNEPKLSEAKFKYSLIIIGYRTIEIESEYDSPRGLFAYLSSNGATDPRDGAWIPSQSITAIGIGWESDLPQEEW